MYGVESCNYSKGVSLDGIDFQVIKQLELAEEMYIKEEEERRRANGQ